MTFITLLNFDGEIKRAPVRGQMLAYTRKEVVYEPYSNLDEVRESLKDEELLEVHLFDNDKEYRAISTTSHRFSDGFIEHIAEFKDGEEDYDVYKKKDILNAKYGSRINILNKIVYDDNHAGMAYVEDYRLVKGDSK